MVIGVVIIFDENEFTCQLSLPPEAVELNSYLGKDAWFEFSKTKSFKGKVVGIEADSFLIIKFEENPLGLGQGSQVHVAD